MKDRMDRCSFLRMAGMSLGIGVVYEFAPLLAQRLEADAITDFLKGGRTRPERHPMRVGLSGNDGRRVRSRSWGRNDSKLGRSTIKVS